MTEWTTPADLRAQLMRRWDKGELLAERVAERVAGRGAPGGLFPLKLALRGPDSRDLSAQFDAVRAWVAQLQQGAQPGVQTGAQPVERPVLPSGSGSGSGTGTGSGTGGSFRLVMRQVQHRVIGQNSLPHEAWVDALDDAIRLIGKTRDARAFDALLQATARQQPALLPWLQRQPLRALALAAQWPHILALLAWLQAHPRPGIYLRQVDLAGIHSKFIEAHRGVLAELLDRVLPAAAINPSHSGAAGFSQRYGFLDKPLRLRFRWLGAPPAGCRIGAWACGGDRGDRGDDRDGGDGGDGGHGGYGHGDGDGDGHGDGHGHGDGDGDGDGDGHDSGDGDYTVSQTMFARLFSATAPAVRQVFITENEINFLAFPSVANGLVIFGAGYGFDALAAVPWLAACALHYWGDIDTHGFAILDQLRAHQPQVQSLLMDRATLLAHRAQWTTEPQPTLRDLGRLNADEQALYGDLRWQRLEAQALRLEQERIGYGWACSAVQRAVAR